MKGERGMKIDVKNQVFSLGSTEDLIRTDKSLASFVKTYYNFTHTDVKLMGSAKQLLVCSQPRSGSTFLTNSIRNALDFHASQMCEIINIPLFAKDYNLTFEDGVSDYVTPSHTPYFPGILGTFAKNNNVVMHHHYIANIQTLWNLARLPNLHIVVTTRNIADSLVSYRDFFKKEAAKGVTDFTAKYGMSGEDFISRFRTKKMMEKFTTHSDEYLLDYMIDLFSPWFFEYVLSWKEVERNGMLNIKFVSYENMIVDEAKTLVDVAEHIGVSLELETARRVVKKEKSEKERSQINVGISGRGSAELTAAQKKRLRNIGEYFADDEVLEKFL
jgi:hypothetical protein